MHTGEITKGETMTRESAELKTLLDMLGTVAEAQFKEQINKVCCAFYDAGQASKNQVPEFKTEQEYEDFLRVVWGKYKTKLYCDGSKAGAEAQQRQLEVQLEYATRNGEKLYNSDVRIALEYARRTVPK
jgi:hypothetical protein